MKTPKMLPWLAHKAGITDARAEALWVEAVHYASTAPVGPDLGASNNVAVTRLLMLIEAEKEALRPTQAIVGNGQDRGRWPFSLIVAMKQKAEEKLAPSTASLTREPILS